VEQLISTVLHCNEVFGLAGVESILLSLRLQAQLYLKSATIPYRTPAISSLDSTQKH